MAPVSQVQDVLPRHFSRSLGNTSDLSALLFGIVASITAVISLVLAMLQFCHSRRLHNEECTAHSGSRLVHNALQDAYPRTNQHTTVGPTVFN